MAFFLMVVVVALAVLEGATADIVLGVVGAVCWVDEGLFTREKDDDLDQPDDECSRSKKKKTCGPKGQREKPPILDLGSRIWISALRVC